MVNVIIDGVSVQVEKGTTVLEAARKAGINIPTLCYLKDVNAIGACRVCLVEVKGAKALQPSCVYPVSEGLEVLTNTAKVREARKAVVELLLSNHPADCLTCVRSGKCELQTLAQQMGIREVRFTGEQSVFPIDDRSVAIVRDPNKCVLCHRCEAVCKKVQGVNILGTINRGFNSTVGPAFGHNLDDINCALCGQCVNVCPTGALTETDGLTAVWAALSDPAKHVVVGPAPSVRVTLGECFGMPIGTNVEGKMIAALRRLGFDKVFDVDNAADFTIMEEGTEFLHRLQNLTLGQTHLRQLRAVKLVRCHLRSLLLPTGRCAPSKRRGSGPPSPGTAPLFAPHRTCHGLHALGNSAVITRRSVPLAAAESFPRWAWTTAFAMDSPMPYPPWPEFREASPR